MTNLRILLVVCCLLGVALPIAVKADPVDVTYTVSGAPGDYILDFTVQNNITGDPGLDLYFLAVDLSDPGIVGSPTPLASENFSPYHGYVTYEFDDGSTIVFNNAWGSTPGYNTLFPDSSLSGFEVQISDLTAPTSVSWLVYGDNGVNENGGWVFDGSEPYTGGGDVYDEITYNPTFIGVASATNSVPDEGSTMALFVVGLIVVAALRRNLSLHLNHCRPIGFDGFRAKKEVRLQGVGLV